MWVSVYLERERERERGGESETERERDANVTSLFVLSCYKTYRNGYRF